MIDIIFAVYQVISIKSAERIKRKKNAVITFHLIVPMHKIKQWQSFLSSSKNKTALIKFLGEQWMANYYSTLLHNKSIYILPQYDCFMYQDDIWQTVDTLTCCHEEADMQMLLHVKCVRDHGAAKVVIHTPDIDVFILKLCFLGEICELCMKTGKGNKKYVINIDAMKQHIEHELAGDIDINKFCAALQCIYW